MEKVRCQSCGMPLGEFRVEGKMEHNFGTNKDGREIREYCKFCFKEGKFVLPNLTVDEMVSRSVKFMSGNLGYSKKEAERVSREIIPKLKRWRKT